MLESSFEAARNSAELTRQVEGIMSKGLPLDGEQLGFSMAKLVHGKRMTPDDCRVLSQFITSRAAGLALSNQYCAVASELLQMSNLVQGAEQVAPQIRQMGAEEVLAGLKLGKPQVDRSQDRPASAFDDMRYLTGLIRQIRRETLSAGDPDEGIIVPQSFDPRRIVAIGVRTRMDQDYRESALRTGRVLFRADFKKFDITNQSENDLCTDVREFLATDDVRKAFRYLEAVALSAMMEPPDPTTN